MLVAMSSDKALEIVRTMFREDLEQGGPDVALRAYQRIRACTDRDHVLAVAFSELDKNMHQRLLHGFSEAVQSLARGIADNARYRSDEATKTTNDRPGLANEKPPRQFRYSWSDGVCHQLLELEAVLEALIWVVMPRNKYEQGHHPPMVMY